VQRIERLHAIGEQLRRSSPRPVAAHVLAERFGVTRRTIERDLASLRLAGLPMYGQVGPGGGSAVLVSSSSSRAFVALTIAEITSLVVAAHHMRGAPYSVAGGAAIDKLLGVLGEPERLAVGALRDRFRLAPSSSSGLPVTTGRARPAANARVRSVVEDAVRLQLAVRITFTDRHGITTRRTVEPTGFYVADERWSLVAWCRARHAGRMFRLDRIWRADPTAQPCVSRNLDEVLGWVPEPGHAP
jgi:predicted DNA-binding transcriptional regulator YafY